MNHSAHDFCENGTFRSCRQRREFGYAGNAERVVSPAVPIQIKPSHTADPGEAAPSMGHALIGRRKYQFGTLVKELNFSKARPGSLVQA